MYLYVCCYNEFDNLAHKPRGSPAEDGIQIFKACEESGKLTWVGCDNSCHNPAFVRLHPRKNIFYTCSESILEEDRVCSYAMQNDGSLQFLKQENLGGKSACYLTIDRHQNHMLYVNYWDSTLGSLPLEGSNAVPGAIKHLVRAEKRVVARHRGDHLTNRQSESHAHAIVLDHTGRVAYVPDLGRDLVHQFLYDEESGQLKPAGRFPCSNETGPHGPRYLEFHPREDIAYLVNELSSTIAVFKVHYDRINDMADGDTTPTMTLLQTVSTLPPKMSPKTAGKKNTCGRVCVHETGNYVFASNRGHDSLAVYRVQDNGTLHYLHNVKTGGETPRHFKFEPSGRFCYVANQDSDTVSVFEFNSRKGFLNPVGNYNIPSPNFIAVSGEMPFSQFYPDNKGYRMPEASRLVSGGAQVTMTSRNVNAKL